MKSEMLYCEGREKRCGLTKRKKKTLNKWMEVYDEKKMRNVLKTAVAINAAFAMLMTFSGGIDKMAYASDVTGQFEFSNAGITVTNTSSGYSIADTALTITASGTYIVTGSCDEGSIVIKKGRQA